MSAKGILHNQSLSKLSSNKFFIQALCYHWKKEAFFAVLVVNSICRQLMYELESCVLKDMLILLDHLFWTITNYMKQIQI